MTKSTSQRKTHRAQLGSRLTEHEFDAALQLIQLSGDSTDSKVGNGICESFDKEEESVGNNTTGGSTADEISSTMNNNNSIIDENNLDDEASPPRNRKFRSILDLYLKTRPLIKKQGKKTKKI